MRMSHAVAALGMLFVSACAQAISGSADSISRLEQARTSDPKSEPVLRSLGIAYFKANRYNDAKTALQQAVVDGPERRRRGAVPWTQRRGAE